VKLIFLGTAGSFPTSHRSLPAIAIQQAHTLCLFDCGEGLQRQIFTAGIKFRHTLKIFVTHLHGDHILGLPGLLQTMSLLNLDKPVEVYGPHGILDFIVNIVKLIRFHLTFPLKIFEVAEGTVVTDPKYTIQCAWTDHNIPNLAYALQETERPGRFFPHKAHDLGVPEGPMWAHLQRGDDLCLPDGRIITPRDVLGPPRPGRKIVYTGDTKPCTSVTRLAKNADILIHDATFDDALHERAKSNGHSTASQAASIAQRAHVKHLILTHLSSRYPDGALLRKQAEHIFPTVTIAEDFLEIHVPFS
jgi:ribonuclease Z